MEKENVNEREGTIKSTLETLKSIGLSFVDEGEVNNLSDGRLQSLEWSASDFGRCVEEFMDMLNYANDYCTQSDELVGFVETIQDSLIFMTSAWRDISNGLGIMDSTQEYMIDEYTKKAEKLKKQLVETEQKMANPIFPLILCDACNSSDVERVIQDEGEGHISQCECKECHLKWVEHPKESKKLLAGRHARIKRRIKKLDKGISWWKKPEYQFFHKIENW